MEAPYGTRPRKSQRPNLDSIDDQIRKAEEQGRINGKYRCPKCGSTYNNYFEAAECCNPKPKDG